MAKAKNVSEIVDAAMIQMILRFNVFGSLASRIGVNVIDSPKDVIAWTDGTGIFLNERQINKLNEEATMTGTSGKIYNVTLSRENIVFVIAHELMHLIGLTYERGKALGLIRGQVGKVAQAKWNLWNMATDYEINSLLFNNEDNSGNREPIGLMPEFGCYDSKYKNMTAEEIYQDLLKENEELLNNAAAIDKGILRLSKSKGSSGGNNKGKEGDSYEVDSNGGEGDSEGEQPSGFDGLGFDLDEHMPLMDDVTKNELISKMNEVFGSRQNGLGCSAIQRTLDATFKPVPFNWRKAMSKYMKTFKPDNYTWSRPSRAGIANSIILPSTSKVAKLNIAAAVDTSGSISNNELSAMMDHLFTILSQFKDFTVDLWCCGSQVYPNTFTTFTQNNKRDLKNFKFESDGGNDMRENFKFIKEKYKGNPPDLFLLLSDFYDPLDGDTETTSPCPCIWLVLDNPKFKPPKLIKAETYPFVVDNDKNY